MHSYCTQNTAIVSSFSGKSNRSKCWNFHVKFAAPINCRCQIDLCRKNALVFNANVISSARIPMSIYSHAYMIHKTSATAGGMDANCAKKMNSVRLTYNNNNVFCTTGWLLLCCLEMSPSTLWLRLPFCDVYAVAKLRLSPGRMHTLHTTYSLRRRCDANRRMQFSINVKR